MLAKNIFTQDSVADFYNANFICFQIDMEKGEGPELARKYGVAAFPTLLYVDKDGMLKHCVVGNQQAHELIRNGEKALKGEQTLLDFQRRYDAGERDRAFVKQYIDVLFKAYRHSCKKRWSRSISIGFPMPSFILGNMGYYYSKSFRPSFSDIEKSGCKTLLFLSCCFPRHH